MCISCLRGTVYTVQQEVGVIGQVSAPLAVCAIIIY